MNIEKILKTSSKNIKSAKAKIKKEAVAQIDANFREVRNNAPGFGKTIRRNRSVVEGSKRDAVDLGNLVESLTYEWRGDTLYVVADSDYFEYVIDGFVSKTGKIIPTREHLLEVSL
jgi:hypothetical protein